MRDSAAPHRLTPGSLLGIGLTLVIALATLVPGRAAATMPGQNGRIAFSSDRNGTQDLWVMDADGSDQALLHSDPVDQYPPYPAWAPSGDEIAFTGEYRPTDRQMDLFRIGAAGGAVLQVTFGNRSGVSPTWSPHGDRIAFSSLGALYVTDLSSGDDPMILTPPGEGELDAFPDWSPDGSLIAFARARDLSPTSGHANLYLVEPGGAQARALTTGTTGFDETPSISPDGQTIVFAHRIGLQSDLYTVPVAGGAPTLLTDTPNFLEQDPTWSPDGTKITFGGKVFHAGADYDIYTIDSDGGNLTQLTSSPGDDTDPAWQRVGVTGYVHPRGATPIRASLVPAYERCAAPNRTHRPPLAFSSCSPPDQASDFATVGTPDANGHPAKSVGSVTLRALAGSRSTAADEADVMIRATITDVRAREGSFAPHAGPLFVLLGIRLTDTDNRCCGDPATLRDEVSLSVETPCGSGPNGSDGSTCEVATTAESLIPGLVPEGGRTTWQMTRPVQVYDGGPGADGTDATLLATQGVFAP